MFLFLLGSLIQEQEEWATVEINQMRRRGFIARGGFPRTDSRVSPTFFARSKSSVHLLEAVSQDISSEKNKKV